LVKGKGDTIKKAHVEAAHVCTAIIKALENDGVKLVYATMPPDLLNRENIRPGV
jgi:putative IMPACT (imprinted ancient) family translation regulator